MNNYHQSFLVLAPTLRDVVQFNFANRPYILLGSILVAATCALFLLSSKEAIRISGKWVKYVGFAFATFSLQYTFRYIAWLSGDSYKILRIVADSAGDFCSGVNNLLFLAAGCVLLNWRTKFLQTKYFFAIVLTTAVLMSAANQYFAEKSSLIFTSLLRLPDALIAAFCLGLFGLAAGLNLTFRRRYYWAGAALMIGLLYALVQLLYAANPLISWSKGELIKAMITQEQYTPTPKDPLVFLDTATFALALPMKFALFLPAGYLFFSVIVEAHDFRKVLRRVIGEEEPLTFLTNRKSWRTVPERQDYLSSDGIVKEIGESVSANLVELFIRLPGLQRPRAWPIVWRLGQTSEPETRVVSIDPSDKECDPLVIQVMDSNEELLSTLSEHLQDIHISQDGNGSKVFTILPIGFHGGVVGCLKAEFSKASYCNYAAVQQLRSMAAILAPSVQDYRALASLDQLGYRFARLQIENPAADFREATKRIAEILEDVLSPLAVGILIDAGFQNTRELAGEDKFKDLLADQIVRSESEELTTAVSRVGTAPVRVHKNLLVMTTRDDGLNTYPIGNLVLIIRASNDKSNAPSFGSYALHRRAVSSLTADAFLDLVRDYFSRVLKNLSIRLNVDGLTKDIWHNEIRTTACNVGLLWVAVTQSKNQNLWGDDAGQAIVKSLSEELMQTLNTTPISCEPHSDQVTKTEMVLRMELRFSKYELWFGVARKGFTPELKCASPWKIFLDSLAEIADSALYNLFMKEQTQADLAKRSQEHGVMNIAITTGLLIHDLGNKIASQVAATESVWRAIERGDVQLEQVQRNKIEAVMNAAKEMKDLMGIFDDTTKLDRRRPCCLYEVAADVIQFYESIPQDTKISFENLIDPALKVDVTFDVAHFAIKNLVSNSQDSLIKVIENNRGSDFQGKIRIETSDERDTVACWVDDNGPGIPADMKSKLFTLGESKKLNHNGWGLYFTRQAVELSGGSIHLTASYPGFTRFTLQFPKARQANNGC